jgi:peptide/nickel transport system permease protein
VWINLFLSEKIPEHKILDTPNINYKISGDVSVTSHQFGVNFDYDDFPNDFIYEFSAKYSGTPLLQIDIIRPDGIQLRLLSSSMPYSNLNSIHSERIFSTDDIIKKNLNLQSNKFLFSSSNLSSEDIIFSKTEKHEPLKGNYVFLIKMYNSNSENQIPESRLIIGGKAFGVMGTDELRRDLAGYLGTPLAFHRTGRGNSSV